MGVVLNRVDRTISYTKRGYDLGVAFEGVGEALLYPAVGFRTPDEEVRGRQRERECVRACLVCVWRFAA